MRLFVEVSSPGVERELKTLNHTMTHILEVLKAEPPDFSVEDAQVKAMTEQVKEAENQLPQP
jgi:ribosome maturation factor RimP